MIVQLYFNREERALRETETKYGRYCYSIAYGILQDAQDADESVNDTWLGAWNSIPPHRPSCLAAYLGKLTRRISLKKRRDRTAQKRGGGQMELALEELAACIPGGDGPELALEAKELTAAVERFLRGLPAVQRNVFICRYWYLDPIGDIAARFGFSDGKVKSMLHRVRGKLREQLKKEGLFDEI